MQTQRRRDRHKIPLHDINPYKSTCKKESLCSLTHIFFIYTVVIIIKREIMESFQKLARKESRVTHSSASLRWKPRNLHDQLSIVLPHVYSNLLVFFSVVICPIMTAPLDLRIHRPSSAVSMIMRSPQSRAVGRPLDFGQCRRGEHEIWSRFWL